MPRCSKCGYSTEDIEAFIQHVVGEREPAEAPKRTHQSAEEYLNCPECFPKFEKAFLKRGYVKPEEKPKKKGMFH